MQLAQELRAAILSGRLVEGAGDVRRARLTASGGGHIVGPSPGASEGA
jgi:hypothetical protein